MSKSSEALEDRALRRTESVPK